MHDPAAKLIFGWLGCCYIYASTPAMSHIQAQSVQASTWMQTSQDERGNPIEEHHGQASFSTSRRRFNRIMDY